MMNEEQIKALSHEFQIDSYSVLREYLQLLFLKYFYETKDSENVFFKGGTALHFLYGSFRFSEDLDFTVATSVAQIHQAEQDAYRRLSVEIQNLELVKLPDRGPGLSRILRYHYGKRHPLTIRLEYSFREKPITRQATPIETRFPVSPYPLVVHMQDEEMLAEKVRALLFRHKGRDLFDLWFLLSKGVRLNNEMIGKKMQWYKKEYDPSNLIHAVEAFTEKDLTADLNQFLPRNYRPFLKQLKQNTLQKLLAE